MIHKFIRTSGSIGFVISLTILAFGQSSVRDAYIISAEAGGVNYVDGVTGIVRSDRTGGRLVKGDKVTIGDRVSTGLDGKAEILLNPGSFLRVGPNSAFEFRSTSLDDLKIAIDRGSAMLEVFATREFAVNLFTPKGRAKIIESGIYRVDVAENGSAKLSVWDGLAMVAGQEVNKGRMATLERGTTSVTKFDRDNKDELAVWSKERGKLIAKATAQLKNQNVRNSLISAYNRGQWGMFDSFGLWIYDPVLRGYCFLPFGTHWYSPYGYGYGNSLWWYNLPPVYYQPPVATPSPFGTKPPRTRDDGEIAGGVGDPPYIRLEQTARQNSPIRDQPDFNNNNTGRSPAPVYNPPPVIISAPSDTGAKTKP